MAADDPAVELVARALHAADCACPDSAAPHAAGDYRAPAEIAVAALRDAGQLLPDAGQTRVEHSFGPAVHLDTLPPGFTYRPIYQRTVTTWPDGTTLTGPWQRAPEEDRTDG